MKLNSFLCALHGALGILLILNQDVGGATANVIAKRVSDFYTNQPPAAIGLPALSRGQVAFASPNEVRVVGIVGSQSLFKVGTEIAGVSDKILQFQSEEDRLNYDLYWGTGGIPLALRLPDSRTTLVMARPGNPNRAPSFQPVLARESAEIFTRYWWSSEQNGTVLFVASSPAGQKGVYSAGPGVLRKIADTSTMDRETGLPFIDFSHARVTSGGTAVFTAYTETGSGIYTERDGKLQLLVGRSTFAARQGAAFTSVLLAALDEDWAYFTALGSPLAIGRVRLNGSDLETLVTDRTILPGSEKPVAALNYVSVDHGRILFEATPSEGAFDLYLWENGMVTAALSRGETIEGGRVVSARCGNQGLEWPLAACLLDLQFAGQGDLVRAVYVVNLKSEPLFTTSPETRSGQTSTRSGGSLLPSSLLTVRARELPTSPEAETNAPPKVIIPSVSPR